MFFKTEFFIYKWHNTKLTHVSRFTPPFFPGGEGGRTNPTLPYRIFLLPPDPHLLFSLIVLADISRESSRWIRSRLLWCRPLP
jgi:hypothetical protein